MTKKISIIGILIASAFVLSFVETFIPFNFSAIGIKLGLANIVVLFALYKYGIREAFLLCIVKIIISGFAFGGIQMLMFSLCGGMFSFLVMIIAKRHFSILSVSVLGAVFHNIGQIFCAAVVYSTLGILSYLPVLLVAGVVTGIIIGSISRIAIDRIKV